MAWMQSTKCWAPPSRKSSRSTLVMTTYLSLSAAMVWASFSGSWVSSGLGRPWPTSQNGQRRVHLSPMIMKVAVPLPKHSPIFGQLAFFAHRHQLVGAQRVLDLVKTRRRRASLDANPLGLFEHFTRYHLDRNARQLGLGFLFDGRVVGASRGCGRVKLSRGGFGFAHALIVAHGPFKGVIIAMAARSWPTGGWATDLWCGSCIYGEAE
jgi:hypothetical protein